MDKGLQIKELAQALNVSPDSVINWELRDIKPRYRHIAMLKRILGINLPVSLLYKGLSCQGYNNLPKNQTEEA